MQGKRRSQIRHNLSLYRLNFAFPTPQILLCDGTFLKQASTLPYLLIPRLSSILKVPCIASITPCVLNELNMLAEILPPATMTLANGLNLHHCKHEEPLEAYRCLISCIGKKNKDKVALFTQDDRLFDLNKEVVELPVFYLKGGNILTLRDLPNELKAKLHRKENEKQRIGAAAWEEKKKIENEKRALEREKLRKEWNALGIRRKKKAKGANPLSSKRKIKK